MIPAKITSLDPVQVTYTNILKPDKDKCFSNAEYRRMVRYYESSKVIADVENITKLGRRTCVRIKTKYKNILGIYPDELCLIKVGMSCFIEESGEGRCRIVKL